MINLSRSRLVPYKHQVVGVQKLFEHPYFFIADEMGAGKTKQVIDAAQVLALHKIINRVIVVAPASVRSVWFDPELGELAKHLWAHFPTLISEYHARITKWHWFVNYEGQQYPPLLRWIITNYDFIRSKDRLRTLMAYTGPQTLLVLDESSAVKNHKALQTKACRELRKRCGRVILLNGTPIANNPADLYSQAEMMNPNILGCKTFYHFRARYAIMGGWQNKQIVNWRDLDDLQSRLAPYVLRRLKVQCLDLPKKLDPVTISVNLSPKTWKLYKEMRDEMVAWLSDSAVSSASQAIVKALRLAQITAGFIGGIEEMEPEGDDPPDFVEQFPSSHATADFRSIITEVGREKLDVLLDWVKEQLNNDPLLKLLIWCRFRPEVDRLHKELAARFKNVELGLIWGGQKKPERDAALRLLDPRTTPSAPVIVTGTPSSGSMGLNLAASHMVVYATNDFSLKTRLQSEDRVHRPGQEYPVSYFDVIASGPDGQKTIDHLVVKALRTKQSLADLTTSAWIKGLMED